METETKQVVEKKVYEDGKKNYANKGEALGIGIPALVLGGVAAASLWGRNRGIAGISGMPENVNINAFGTAANGTNAPTAFQTWEKECSDALALTNELWGMKLNTEREMYAHRETDVREKHELWRSQINADFGLYKSQRDLYDVLHPPVSRPLDTMRNRPRFQRECELHGQEDLPRHLRRCRPAFHPDGNRPRRGEPVRMQLPGTGKFHPRGLKRLK